MLGLCLLNVRTPVFSPLAGKLFCRLKSLVFLCAFIIYLSFFYSFFPCERWGQGATRQYQGQAVARAAAGSCRGACWTWHAVTGVVGAVRVVGGCSEAAARLAGVLLHLCQRFWERALPKKRNVSNTCCFRKTSRLVSQHHFSTTPVPDSRKFAVHHRCAVITISLERVLECNDETIHI